ncbi:hypothetical protein [Streptomyces chartreusis]|uniref:Secreted protein n=1 Tax=Streptomyces chartreusis TaxID=1969 RepID=A0A7H8TJP5_STRCX|nr:hypothetical protein [Streptomyces chartreusis]QKZ23278.1 hypothetical protein HUT05_41525 [Streptomyces chartreusis]
MSNAAKVRKSFKRTLTRTAVASALCATVFTALASAPAQAAENWGYLGPIRATQAEAQRDLDPILQQCKDQGGVPNDANAYPRADGGTWEARMKCILN